MNIPGAFKILLIENGFTSRYVLVKTGVSADTMRKALNSANPTIKSLAKYCTPINVKVSELIARAETLNKEVK